MYTNQEFEILKNNQARLATTELDNLIFEIETYYANYNKLYNRYTANYTITMENLMSKFDIKSCIDRKYGGSLYVSTNVCEDIEAILDKTRKYIDYLHTPSRITAFVSFPMYFVSTPFNILKSFVLSISFSLFYILKYIDEFII